MKVMIVSDTHGKDKNFEKALLKEAPIDALIHCGDGEGREDYYEVLCECPAYFVRGNCDRNSSLSSEIVIELEGHRIMVTHGHYYGVSMGLDWLVDAAREHKADIVMYGHTHKPDLQLRGDVTAVNPGSLTQPRQNDRKPTYLIMEIDEKNNVNFFKKVVDK